MYPDKPTSVGPGRPLDLSASADRPEVDPVCPFTVERPVMAQRWERLAFVHWSFEPEAVGRLLPPNLAVDTWEGRAWVGLVPFYMRVATPGGRAAPWASSFRETNVRTYVIDQEGRRGIWFFSLDAARLGAVLAARTIYRLPYFWSSLTLAARRPTGGPAQSPGTGDEIGYTCRRRWPGPTGAASRVRVRIGAPFLGGELGPRDHFLTARWVLFSSAGTRQRYARVWHEPWPLCRAELAEVDDGLLRAAGLPGPQGDPLVHYSPGVDVRIGRPERYAGHPAHR